MCSVLVLNGESLACERGVYTCHRNSLTALPQLTVQLGIVQGGACESWLLICELALFFLMFTLRCVLGDKCLGSGCAMSCWVFCGTDGCFDFHPFDITPCQMLRVRMSPCMWHVAMHCACPGASSKERQSFLITARVSSWWEFIGSFVRVPIKAEMTSGEHYSRVSEGWKKWIQIWTPILYLDIGCLKGSWRGPGKWGGSMEKNVQCLGSYTFLKIWFFL